MITTVSIAELLEHGVTPQPHEAVAVAQGIMAPPGHVIPVRAGDHVGTGDPAGPGDPAGAGEPGGRREPEGHGELSERIVARPPFGPPSPHTVRLGVDGSV